MSFIYAIRDWISHKLRARNKSRNYQRYVNESTKSLEERLRFHFEHIDLYWKRCEGFITVWSVDDVMLTLFQDIPVASQATTIDLNKLQNGKSQLFKTQWNAYLQAVSDLQVAKTKTQQLFNNARDAFKQVHNTFMKLAISQ